MTGKQPHDENARLASLYREGGEVEPDAGLDWRIRAQAHRDLRRSRLPRPAHWLGGVAVAASLFVVVSVVTQMAPPQGEFPESEPPPSEASLEEDVVVTGARRSASPVVGEQRTAPAERDRAAADAFSPAPPPVLSRLAESPGDGTSESDELIEQGRARTLERLATERVPLDPELGFSEARALPDSSTDAGAQKQLWLIEQFIVLGDADRASAELERLREEHPEVEVPDELMDALQALQSIEED